MKLSSFGKFTLAGISSGLLIVTVFTWFLTKMTIMVVDEVSISNVLVLSFSFILSIRVIYQLFNELEMTTNKKVLDNLLKAGAINPLYYYALSHDNKQDQRVISNDDEGLVQFTRSYLELKSKYYKLISIVGGLLALVVSATVIYWNVVK